MMRLDKLLAHCGFGTRKEVKNILKTKVVTVNDTVITDGAFKVDEYKDEVCYDLIPIVYEKFVYLMLNKPKGVISSTKERDDTTVIDLLDGQYDHYKLFPVGRLDRDTTGLLLLTNDGKLAHGLLSPKHDVGKIYHVTLDRELEDLTEAFNEEMVLEDGTCFKKAKFELLSANTCYLTICEGKFHQVKRMFDHLGYTVVELERRQMKTLILDQTLEYGQYRDLTEEELSQLRSFK